MHRLYHLCRHRAFVCCIVLIAASATQCTSGVAGERRESVAPRAVTKAVNALAPTDIAIAAATSTPCSLAKLPGSMSKLLPLLPSDHRPLFEECARGRMKIKRTVSAFDLVTAIDDPADRPAAVATLRAFFDGRAVDAAMGVGLSGDPYPISFDWVVILDPQSQTLFSFVLNCHD
jgi:hypothetical protein